MVNNTNGNNNGANGNGNGKGNGNGNGNGNGRGGCSLQQPGAYRPPCNPSPFHWSCCGDYFKLNHKDWQYVYEYAKN